jgi:hypothetical protein
MMIQSDFIFFRGMGQPPNRNGAIVSTTLLAQLRDEAPGQLLVQWQHASYLNGDRSRWGRKSWGPSYGNEKCWGKNHGKKNMEKNHGILFGWLFQNWWVHFLLETGMRPISATGTGTKMTKAAWYEGKVPCFPNFTQLL